MKILLSIIIFLGILFAEETKQKSPYVVDGFKYEPQDCSYTCEAVKDGYFTRVSDVNLEKGLITCNIYSVKEPLQVLETRYLHNNFCEKKFTFVPDLSKKDNAYEFRLDEKLKMLETKYFHNFINTGTIKYLTAPEYLVAILTADADIIDMKATIEENSIILNDGYTVYPNENKNYENNFIEKTWDFFASLNPFDDEKNTMIPNEKYPIELKSSTSQLISTIGVMWLDFLMEINFLYAEANLLIVMVVSPFSLIVLAGETVTNRLSKVNNANNWVGNGIVSAIVFLTMFTSYNVAKTGVEDFIGKEKSLDQSFYQDQTGFLISTGVQIANSFNAGYSKVYINQMARNASVNPSLSMEQREQKMDFFLHQNGEYKKYLDTCLEIYNVENLSTISTNLYAMPMRFPPNESKAGINFYYHLNNPNDEIKSNLYSVSSCYKVNRAKNTLAIRMQNLEKEIENNKEALKNNMEERVLNIAEVAYKNAVEMGFLSALTLSSMNATLSNLDEWQHFSDNIDDKRDYIESETQKAISTNSNLGASDFLDNDFVSILPKSIPYAVMPYFNDIYKAVDKLAGMGGNIKQSVLDKANEEDEPIKKSSLGGLGGKQKIEKKSGNLSMLSKFVVKIAKSHPSFAFLEALLKGGSTAIIFGVSVWLYDYMLSLLVPFAILSAGLIVVLFWIAEIVIYYLVVPFMLAYAMLKSQGNAIGKFLARGLIISARPTLIVFSIVVATLLYSLYEAVSVFIITKNFSAIFGLNELGLIDTFTGLIQQGFFEIALKIMIPFIMFFIILIGSTMFLKQFGYSDDADLQQHMQQLENKGSKYGMPV